MEPIRRFAATLVALPMDDIDTDQIIPARFLQGTGKDGLSGALFADWRYRADGTPDPAFPLNRPGAQGAGILVAGHNFGCGSSREHAAWALLDFGFRAVISTGFADIFRSNALANALIPVEVDAATHAHLVRLCAVPSRDAAVVDVATGVLTLPDGGRVDFPLDPFAQHCLLRGVDRLGFLLSHEEDIARYEAAHDDRSYTTAVPA